MQSSESCLRPLVSSQVPRLLPRPLSGQGGDLRPESCGETVAILTMSTYSVKFTLGNGQMTVSDIVILLGGET